MVLNYKECDSNQQLFRKQQYQKRFYCSGKKHRLYASAVYNLFTSTVQYNSNKITACKSGITPGLWEEISTRRFLLFSLEWLKEARDRIKSSYESLGNTDMCLAHKKRIWKLFYIQLKKKINPKKKIYLLEVIMSQFCEYFHIREDLFIWLKPCMGRIRPEIT